MRGIKMVIGGLTLGLMLTLSGCVVLPVDEGWNGYYEPVPYGVPVDGYGYRNPDGLSVVYDSGPEVYVVQEYPGVYWLNNHYYREHGGYWESSRRHLGPWQRHRAENLPFGHRTGYPHGQRAPVRYRDSGRDTARGPDWAQPRDRGPIRAHDSGWDRNRMSYPAQDREQRRGWTPDRYFDSRGKQDRRHDQESVMEMRPRQDWKRDSYPRLNNKGNESRDRDFRPQPSQRRDARRNLQPVSGPKEIRGGTSVRGASEARKQGRQPGHQRSRDRDPDSGGSS